MTDLITIRFFDKNRPPMFLHFIGYNILSNYIYLKLPPDEILELLEKSYFLSLIKINYFNSIFNSWTKCFGGLTVNFDWNPAIIKSLTISPMLISNYAKDKGKPVEISVGVTVRF